MTEPITIKAGDAEEDERAVVAAAACCIDLIGSVLEGLTAQARNSGDKNGTH